MERFLNKNIILEIFKYLSQKDIANCRCLKPFSDVANEFISMKYKYYSSIENFDLVTLKKFCKKGEYLAVVYFINKYGGLDLTFDSMFSACKSGNVDIVKLLIRNRCHVKYSFLWACGMGYTDILEILFRINDTDWDWGRGVDRACENGHMKVIKVLMEKAKEDYVWDWNYYLRSACRGGNMEIVKFLIEKGANEWNRGLVNACDGGHLEVVKLLIERGANDWNRGLSAACSQGHVEVVELMMELGANDWNEGFFRATENRKLITANLMLEKGATNLEECYRFAEDHFFYDIVELIKKKRATSVIEEDDYYDSD